MCGISGLIHLNGNAIHLPLLQAMGNAILHRGRDDNGLFTKNNMGISHQRLHIIGDNKSGAQPMNFMDRYHFVFNGTLYNYTFLREILIAEKIDVSGNSDSEIAFHWLIHFGLKNISLWEGMFAFIFYDSLKNTFWIRRDPLGIKPLYYSFLNGYLAFSSETKSFFHFKDWNYDVLTSDILLFLTTGEREIQGNPFWRKASAIPLGGTCLVSFESLKRFKITFLKDDKLENEKNYFQKQESTLEEVVLVGKSLFKNSIHSHLQGTGKLGISLSGGIDSALIFSYLKMLHTATLPIVISYTEIEKKPLMMLKNHYIADYYTLTKPSFSQFQQSHQEVLFFSEGPVAAPNAVHHYDIYAQAKNLGLKIMLSGQGADELCLGYPSMLKLFWKEMIIQNLPLKLVTEVLGSLYFRKELILPFILSLAKKKNEIRIGSSENLFHEREKVLFKSNLPYLLHAEDRHSMANHIESRVPFLDTSFQKFVRSLPSKYLIQKGRQKWLLRKMGENVLPKTILNCYAKAGFPSFMPIPNAKEKSEFLAHIDQFIAHNKSCLILPTKNASQIYNQFPSLAWRIYSFQQWKYRYNIDCI